MSRWVQDELPIDWSGLEDDDDFYEDDERTEAVQHIFESGEKGATAAPVPQTAFIVVIGPEGDAEAHSRIDSWPAQVQREATLGDIRRGCNEVTTEINLQAAASFAAGIIKPTVVGSGERIREALRLRGVEIKEA